MKNKNVYVCSCCGYQSAKWLGKCPSCNEWNTMEEQIVVSQTSKQSSNKPYLIRVLTNSTGFSAGVL